MKFSNNKIKLLLLTLTSFTLSCFVASALIVTDSAGNTIEILKAGRISWLNSDPLEALIMLGAKEWIVLGNYALQKPYAPNVTDVGKWSEPNVEAMISVNPDVVITYVNYPERQKLEDKLKGLTALDLSFRR